MGNFHSRLGSAFVAASCVFSLSVKVLAATPSPPVSICVDNSCTQTVVAASSSASAIKFNPGHYAWYDGIFYNTSGFGTRKTGLLSFIDNTVCKEAGLQGVQITVQWGALEGPTAGTYTGFTITDGTAGGFAFIDEVLSHLSSCGKKLMLAVGSYQIYGGEDGTKSFPSYLYSSSYGTVQSYNGNGFRMGAIVIIPQSTYDFLSNGEVTPAFWEAPIMDRLIALTKAYGARYNNNSAFEMISPVTNLAFTTPYYTFGYSTTATATQVVRLTTAARAAWPNTAIRIWIDYFAPDAQTADLVDALAPLNVIIGGNDVLPAEDITADRAFNGAIRNDYRGIVPWISNVATPELCGKEGTYTPSQLFNHVMDGNSSTGIRAQRPQYVAWITSDACPGTAENWSTAILPFIRNINGAVSGGQDSTRIATATVKANYCPKGYKGGCK